MSLLLQCDTCKKRVEKGRGMPKGWRASCEYRPRGARKVFVRMRHACPTCPMDVPREQVEELPVCTVQEALAEVEECARFAAQDDDELKGSSRKLVVRALAILDAARARIAGG